MSDRAIPVSPYIAAAIKNAGFSVEARAALVEYIDRRRVVRVIPDRHVWAARERSVFGWLGL